MTYVSLPTRGLFAEALLGDCNSCETRDVTRFWRWEKSPCLDQAPAISGVQPGPQGQPPPRSHRRRRLLPSSRSQHRPRLPTRPGWPRLSPCSGRPTSFATCRGRPNSCNCLADWHPARSDWRDARPLAQALQQRLSSSASQNPLSQLLGQGAGGGAPTRPQSSSDLYDKLQVTEDARQRGMISDEAAREAAQRYLEADSGTPEIQQAGYFGDRVTFFGAIADTWGFGPAGLRREHRKARPSDRSTISRRWRPGPRHVARWRRSSSRTTRSASPPTVLLQILSLPSIASKCCTTLISSFAKRSLEQRPL